MSPVTYVRGNLLPDEFVFSLTILSGTRRVYMYHFIWIRGEYEAKRGANWEVMYHTAISRPWSFHFWVLLCSGPWHTVYPSNVKLGEGTITAMMTFSYSYFVNVKNSNLHYSTVAFSFWVLLWLEVRHDCIYMVTVWYIHIYMVIVWYFHSYMVTVWYIHIYMVTVWYIHIYITTMWHDISRGIYH